MSVQYIQTQHEHVSDNGNEYPIHQWAPTSVKSTNALIKMGIVFPDAICRTHGLVSSLSGGPATISDLAIIVSASISVVTRHDLFLICLSAFRLRLSILVNIVNV